MQYQSAGSHDFCAQIRFRNSANPNGIASQSPGLRGTSYPGQEAQETTTPAGLRRPRRTFTKAETPLGFRSPDPLPQGSSCLATLGFVAESRWDSGKRHFQNLIWAAQLLCVSDCSQTFQRTLQQRVQLRCSHQQSYRGLPSSDRNRTRSRNSARVNGSTRPVGIREPFGFFVLMVSRRRRTSLFCSRSRNTSSLPVSRT